MRASKKAMAFTRSNKVFIEFFSLKEIDEALEVFESGVVFKPVIKM